MFTTWLGEYTALEVGMEHYIVMGVAFLIAILTTAESMWQNVYERSEEIALLKAIGWRNKTIYTIILTEGFLASVLEGILGITISINFIWEMYQKFPYEHNGFVFQQFHLLP